MLIRSDVLTSAEEVQFVSFQDGEILSRDSAMIPEYQRQLEQLSKNAMVLAEREKARITRELRAIDRANEKRGYNGSGAARPNKIQLAPLTLHDKAQNNPLLRKMLRDIQRGI